jgi:hypothetical protein
MDISHRPPILATLPLIISCQTLNALDLTGEIKVELPDPKGCIGRFFRAERPLVIKIL